MGKALATVKVGPLEYEAEVLTAAIEPSYVQASIESIVDYADEHFNRLADDGSGILKYQPNTLKDKKEYKLFNSYVDKFVVILAADKHGVFESVQQLFDLARTDKEGFEKIYQAATRANPSFKPGPIEVPKEGEPNPLA